jgi:hypothetical protein
LYKELVTNNNIAAVKKLLDEDFDAELEEPLFQQDIDVLQKKLKRRENQHQIDIAKLVSLEQENELLKLKYCTLDKQYSEMKEQKVGSCRAISF